METIRNYLESMFKNLPQTDVVVKAKYELGQMMEDKYSELIKEGKSENEAIGTVITEFGNLEEIAKELGIEDIYKGTGTAAPNEGVFTDYIKNAGAYANAAENKKGVKGKGKIRYINKTAKTVMEVYWPSITCIYLCYSFITFDWHISWIIWPLAAIVHTVLKNCLTVDEDEE